MTAMPSATDVQAIAAIGEPVLRNLRITAAYGDLSRAMTQWWPGAANWCTFATWASRQAGCTIRKEDLRDLVARRLERRLERRPLLRRLHDVTGIDITRLAEVAGDLSQALPGIDRASDAVARGNLKVFAEIGYEFARFLAAMAEFPLEGGAGTPAAVTAFIASLTPGPPPDGQELLKLAFARYVAARHATSRALRAQLMLLGNVEIGLHEQTRLQPEIREAMDAAMLDIADTRRRVIERLETVLLAPLRPGRGRLGRDLLNLAAEDIAVALRGVVREITTERVMTLGLPGRPALRLGHDVSGDYPPDLATLTLDDLRALLAQYDATADSTRDSAAIDWSVLPQRLRYIADLFRACQEDPALLAPPFSTTQMADITAGRVPTQL